MRDVIECEVAIVGAGLAGLSAAVELERRGVDVGVIEAQGEVGGRTRSREFAGRIVELGGTFLSRRQRRITRLIRELGLTLHSTGLWGSRVRWHSPREGTGSLPRLNRTELRGLFEFGLAAHRQARRVDPDRPWAGDGAAALDRISVAEWIERSGVSGNARWLIETAVGGYASQPVERLSLLQYLWWISRYGGNVPALRTGNSFYVAEGAQQIARRLSCRLSRPPRLSTAIEVVEQSDSAVSLHSDGELVCTARLAIVTSPLAALEQISFHPSLPEELAECHRVLKPGHITKLGAVTLAPAPVRHRCVVGGEPLAWTMRLDSELIGYGLRSTVGIDGDELLAHLAHDYELSPDSIQGAAVDWSSEPFSRGSYVAFAPGQITRYAKKLRRSHGLVRFAGAERSSMPQQMEGALESGERAAQEAHRALSEARDTPSGARA